MEFYKVAFQGQVRTANGMAATPTPPSKVLLKHRHAGSAGSAQSPAALAASVSWNVDGAGPWGMSKALRDGRRCSAAQEDRCCRKQMLLTNHSRGQQVQLPWKVDGVPLEQ